METLDRSVLTFLVNALWQAPLVAAAVALACRWMKDAPARHTHAVCVAGLALALLLPVASMRRAAPEMAAIAVPQRLDVAPAASAPAPVTASAPPRTVDVPRQAVSIGLWALAAFLLARLLLLALAGCKTLRLCRTARTGGACAAFDRAREAFGLDRVELRWSAEVTGPVTAGRSVILPESMADASEDVLATAIGHEMAHIARRDFFWNVLYELAALPVSFHPATIWLRRQIDRTREIACDELVTDRLVDSRTYAQSIVDIASSMTAMTRPGYTLGVFDGDILEERIRRLLRRPAEYSRRARRVLGAALGTVAACAVIASGLAISARAQGPAMPELRAGADAYNAGNFGAAIEHFEKAVAIDPDSVKARLLLVHAYLRLDAGANKEKAQEQAAEAVRRDPRNVAATVALVSLTGASGVKESREMLLRLVAANPDSKEAYYTTAVFDWMIVYPRYVKAMPAQTARQYARLTDPSLRSELLPYVLEGQEMAQHALRLDPQYGDAMAYMNLLDRLRAALAENDTEAARWIAEADEWVGKALAARKFRTAGPDRVDPDAPAPTALPMMAPAPPPPPPPPPGVPRGERGK
jgi:beta-lactamase regulating signal transducer with metallopeptidase domain